MKLTQLARKWLGLKTDQLNQKLDQDTDPTILIDRGIASAQRSHRDRMGKAEKVIGNEKLLKRNLESARKREKDYVGKILSAKKLVDAALAAGNQAEAETLTAAMQQLARQVASERRNIAELAQDLASTTAAADQARNIAAQSRDNLEDERNRAADLRRMDDQTKLANSTSAMLESMDPGRVPTEIDEARARIEADSALAEGRAELASQSTAGAQLAIDRAARESAADDILASILGPDSESAIGSTTNPKSLAPSQES